MVRRSLPSYVLAYFDNLMSEYDAICWEATPQQTTLINGTKSLVDEFIRKRGEKVPTLTWRELFIFEKLILRLQPLDRLRRRVWGLRSQFATVFGRDELAEYLGSIPPDPLTAKEQELRADTEQILSSFHWLYTVIPHRERVRDQLSKQIMKGMFIGVVGALLILFIEYIWPSYKLGSLVMVLIMGMLGSWVSMQRRLQTVPNSGDPIVNMETLKGARSSIILSPLTGAIFAALVYLTFLGGLLEGTLFPKINSLTSSVDDKSLGLLLIWAFVAGFAERLIPDALDRMIDQYQGEATGHAAGQAARAGRSRAGILGQMGAGRDGTVGADAGGHDEEVGGSGRGSTHDASAGAGNVGASEPGNQLS